MTTLYDFPWLYEETTSQCFWQISERKVIRIFSFSDATAICIHYTDILQIWFMHQRVNDSRHELLCHTTTGIRCTTAWIMLVSHSRESYRTVLKYIINT